MSTTLPCLRDARSCTSGSPTWLVSWADGGWWSPDDDVDLCDQDPGHDIDVAVAATLRDLTDVWRGESTWTESLRDGRVALTGSARLRRDVPTWFATTGFAQVPRATGALVEV